MIEYKDYTLYIAISQIFQHTELLLEIEKKEAEQTLDTYPEELGGEFYYDTDGSLADW